MATQKLNLTRDQLSTFLKDHEQIKQFERLFAAVDTIAPDVVNEVKIDAGTAQATAVQALAQIASLAQEAAVCCSISDVKATQALDQIADLEQETAVSIASAENKADQAIALLSRLVDAVEGLSDVGHRTPDGVACALHGLRVGVVHRDGAAQDEGVIEAFEDVLERNNFFFGKTVCHFALPFNGSDYARF